MAHVIRGTRPVVARDELDMVDEHEYASDRALLAIRGLISLVGGVIVALLGLRFVLSLLGANRSNAFASMIYSASHPFVAPFFGLFNYREQFGVSRIEVETIVAIIFWAVVTWFFSYLVTIGMRRRTTY